MWWPAGWPPPSWVFGDLIAPHGVYVCGSLKEEFGLALIEALAAGLVVVGPEGGGPATYIDEGVTGFLVDTRSPRAVGAGIAAALDLVARPGDERRVAHGAGDGGRPVHHRGDGARAGRRLHRCRRPGPDAGRVVTLLVISPDYASHLLPLATLATAWRDAGERVVVASGPATASITAEFGFERRDLRLGRGSNPGVIRAEDQVRRRGRRAARVLRRHRARDGGNPAVPGQCAQRRSAVGPGEHRHPGARCGATRCSPITSSSIIWRSVRGSRCWPATYRTPTWCSVTRARCRSATRCTGIRRPGRRCSTPIRAPWPRCCSGAGRSGTISPNSGTPH